MNNAAVNVGVQIPAFNSFANVPRGGIAGSYSDFMLNFLSTCQTFVHMLQFYITTSSARMFQFIYILTGTGYFMFFVFVGLSLGLLFLVMARLLGRK